MKKLLPLILILFAEPCFGDEETFNAVLSGKTCKTTSVQTITCLYEVSDSLSFEITGIGTYDAVIKFLKSDYEGDYYGSIGMFHSCVIIKSNKKLGGYAFVSPKNGEVYRFWERCKEGL